MLAGTASAPSPEGMSGIDASTGRPSSVSTSRSSRRRPSNQSTRNTMPSASSRPTIVPIIRFVPTCGVLVASSAERGLRDRDVADPGRARDRRVVELLLQRVVGVFGQLLLALEASICADSRRQLGELRVDRRRAVSRAARAVRCRSALIARAAASCCESLLVDGVRDRVRRRRRSSPAGARSRGSGRRSAA